MFIKNSILEKQLKIVANNFLKANINNKKINFRCNICGDSPSNKNKKSAYLILRRNYKFGGETWQFYCHRGSCGKSMLAEIWLKHYFPSNFKMYQSDLLSFDNDNEETIKKLEQEYQEQKKIETEQKKIEELEDIKYFIPILDKDDKIFKDAIEICNKRLINENIWKKWFVSVDKKYKNRIIIPFYDNNDEIYYWQGRSIYDWMNPKYLNRSDNRDLAIYNYFNINKEKEVIVVEGPIDSMFLDNTIAIIGTNITENAKKLILNLRKYFLFDNDSAGYKKSIEYLKLGENVFIWKKFLKDLNINKNIKDVNELVIKYPEFLGKLNFTFLQKYFTNNLFDQIYLM